MQNVSKGTIVRTILLVLVLINMGLKALGKDAINVSENEVYAFIEVVIEFGILITGFWKNNSFTKQAAFADRIMTKPKADMPIDEGE